jgi:sarcosine oxidase subunit alpha
MSRHHNRLPANTEKGFSGLHIDRARPIRFTLDGRVIPAFHGDTVLSALIASGVDTIGTHGGAALGLRSEAPPSIQPVFSSDHAPLPMERTPATDGAQYRTVATGCRAGLFTRLFQPGRTLGLALGDRSATLPRPWRTLTPEHADATDLVIIGGGVAGMSAALAGADFGLNVTLIEASPHLGGNSGLFGTQDGEPAPEENISRLTDEVAERDNITVWTHSEAFAIGERMVRLHRVDSLEGQVRGRILDLPTRFIVIATGAFERLPVFSGNRLPGVVGALEAFELARRYGIWQGESWMLATSSNPAYRLATQMNDTGLRLDRILEARDRASSRFIEFCKAYGIRQFPGTLPHSVTQRGRGLAVNIGNGEPILTDRLVVCGGWQPDLTLWHMAGGQSRWDEKRSRLEPAGVIPGLALAGSAAGYFTRRACIASGREAVSRLLGRKTKGFDDPVIDPFYETPDALVAHPGSEGETQNPAYLDAGETLLARPVDAPPRWRDRFRSRPARAVRLLSEAPQPLSIGAICAGVGLGLIPPASAGVVAQERVAHVPIGTPSVAPPVPPPNAGIPAYLVGRFGPGQALVSLRHDLSWRIDSGVLIYGDFDEVDPRRAVGVVVRHDASGTKALVAASVAREKRKVIARLLGQAVTVEIEPGG